MSRRRDDSGGVVLRLLLVALLVLGIAAGAGVGPVRQLWRDGAATVGAAVRERVEPYLEELPAPRPEGAEPEDEPPATGAVGEAVESVVRVGVAGCGRAGVGSGFVYAHDHVMTNAHVVRGASRVQVQADGQRWSAEVVLYDPETDVAVLHAPGLPLPPLAFAPRAATAGTSATVAGHPRGGPLRLTDARVMDVRGSGRWTRTDRESYVVRADVQPGNSGGPLLDAQGRVLGVVYAAAVTQRNLGFVLTADAVADEAASAARSATEVATGGCAG